MTGREVIWSDPAAPGLEHLKLVRNGDGFVADGLCIGRTGESPPCRLHYVILIDPEWQMRSATLQVLDGTDSPAELTLSVDDNYTWRDHAGEAIAELAGCHEIDLAGSPFTNTLPIRRLGLAPGESAEISVARVELPDLRVRPVRQIYRCIEPLGPEGGRYGFESLFGDKSAEVSVDQDGLVVENPDSFRRVWAS